MFLHSFGVFSQIERFNPDFHYWRNGLCGYFRCFNYLGLLWLLFLLFLSKDIVQYIYTFLKFNQFLVRKPKTQNLRDADPCTDTLKSKSWKTTKNHYNENALRKNKYFIKKTVTFKLTFIVDTFVKQWVNNCCPSVSVKYTDDALPNCCYGNKVDGFKKGSVHSDVMVQTSI